MHLLVMASVLLLCTLTPWRDWCGAVDNRECDGERYTTACVGRYQQPETWRCVEVAR